MLLKFIFQTNQQTNQIDQNQDLMLKLSQFLFWPFQLHSSVDFAKLGEVFGLAGKVIISNCCDLQKLSRALIWCPQARSLRAYTCRRQLWKPQAFPGISSIACDIRTRYFCTQHCDKNMILSHWCSRLFEWIHDIQDKTALYSIDPFKHKNRRLNNNTLLLMRSFN